MTMELTVTSKGQVTLRRSLLEHLGVTAGRKVGVSLLPDGRVELIATGAAPGIRRLRGSLRQAGRAPVSLAEMQEAIETSRHP